MKFIAFIFSFLVWSVSAQDTTNIIATDTVITNADVDPDSLTYQRFLDVVENSLFEYYNETWGKEKAYQIIDSLGYDSDEKPQFSDSIYVSRLNHLNESTIIEIEINDDLLKTVKYFAKNRRRFTAVCIGRSKLFFPMYEEHLDQYEIPLELKYLSVIESGLRPTVKSRVGATGLWQFMYRTGRMFGLDNDSYVDERMDPVKATDAACRYLKYLHGLYGDWSIALAAYNAGPGNVNKAIRRSGGQMNYWKLRPFLPKETQMYVPNFIAMMYMMTYYSDHNIIPKEAQIYLHEVDTVCLNSSIRISHLDSMLGMTANEFEYLNPVYKTDVIPKTDIRQCITLPIAKIDSFLVIEDSLYKHDAYLDKTGQSFVALEKKKTHIVKENETIAQIAQKYDVTVNDIRGWNGLKTNKIYPGQRLTIRLKERKYFASTSASSGSSSSSRTNSSSSKTPPKTHDDGKYKYYTLKSGESLWTVSQKFGIPFATIQSLNKDIDPKRMQPGDKIKIKQL
ncbi:MAG: LysM peptidoglycan-binding domain-containing protein [Crocinitomix sp.]|nr:LysM peptidoglycan-binding domain-containing protein [Crocinitomix sp.]